MKKGFTLIELLAVIVILSIVSIVSIPKIINVLDSAKKSYGLSEANLIFNTIDNYCEMEKNNIKNTNFCLSSDNLNKNLNKIIDLKESKIFELEIKDKKLIWLKIQSKGFNFGLNIDKMEENYEKPILIIDEIIKNYPFLEVEENNGCKVYNSNSYSYMGGCYLKNLPQKNYIWYSGILWRIMGINKDGTIKLIADENLATISWGKSGNDWNNSYVNDWLNNYFYKRLIDTVIEENKIINTKIIKQNYCMNDFIKIPDFNNNDYSQCVKNISKNSINVGLLTLEEYYLAGAKNSYLFINQSQWLMSSYNSNYVWNINTDGTTPQYGGRVLNSYGVRPVISVKEDLIINGGNGTINEIWNKETGPYIIKSSKKNKSNLLIENSTYGEYVEFSGRKYRIVDKTSKGIKIILDDYYHKFSIFGENSDFFLDKGIGKELNTNLINWLVNSEDDKKKLATSFEWSQTNYDGNFRTSLNGKLNKFYSPIGFIKIGEFLSAQSNSILTKNYQTQTNFNNSKWYWTFNKNESTKNFYINSNGGLGEYNSKNAVGIRPVIVILPEIKIKSGAGTWFNPYKI